MYDKQLTFELSRFCLSGQTTGRDKGRLLCLSRVPLVLKGRGTGQQAVPSASTGVPPPPYKESISECKINAGLTSCSICPGVNFSGKFVTWRCRDLRQTNQCQHRNDQLRRRSPPAGRKTLGRNVGHGAESQGNRRCRKTQKRRSQNGTA
jgi:hypothetical protein